MEFGTKWSRNPRMQRIGEVRKGEEWTGIMKNRVGST